MCRERARERGYVHPQNSENREGGTISVIHDLHISLLIGDGIERETHTEERERLERERERDLQISEREEEREQGEREGGEREAMSTHVKL